MNTISLEKSSSVIHNDYFEFESWKIPANVETLKIRGGDYHTNSVFISNIYSWFNRSPLYILDIGCGGARMIEDFVNDGHIGIGLDLNPAYFKHSAGAWGKIPNNLFVCDVGKELCLIETDEVADSYQIKFDLITSWEALEHIRPEDIDVVMSNIQSHTIVGSYFAGSSSEMQCRVHRLNKNSGWWTNKFNEIGFEIDEDFQNHIGKNYVRDCPQSSYYFMKRVR